VDAEIDERRKFEGIPRKTIKTIKRKRERERERHGK